MANTHHYRYEAQPVKNKLIDREAWIAQALAATARLRVAEKSPPRKKTPSRRR